MRAIGGLDHPAIIRATDAGECNETLYLVMDPIDGADLNRVSRSQGPLRVADACAIGIEVARGLAHAHNQGVVHRDIKPSNLMLDRSGNVKILDFGLARMQSPACDVSLQTTMGQLLGTLDYMAPEQASGSSIDARVDIYALGATIFKLLTGVPPHGRSADMPIIEFLNRLANSEASRLDQHRDRLPDELVELIAVMLQSDPQRRIATADEVADALQPFSAAADLQALASNAIEMTTRSQDDDRDSVAHNLADFLSKPMPSDAPEQTHPSSAARRRQIGALGCIAAAAVLTSLFGFVFLTITVMLKSPEGEIRFESNVPDHVRVEVVDEKDRVDVIAVEQGGATTTLRTGRYRIRLDSPSDGIEITPRELVIKRDKVAIAKLTQLAGKQVAGEVVAERNPIIAMEAQLELDKTTAELADAKTQQTPDAEVIKSLEEKLVRLRALSRPIPTEPVYEGRTLADWMAQMRFEQHSDTKKLAAENVLKLAATRPDAEKMELLFDAASRLAFWSSSFENSLQDRFDSTRNLPVTLSITKIDRQVASAHIVRALLGSDQRLSNYALITCADMRSEMVDGEWPSLLAALELRSEADTGAAQVAVQITLAACMPDASRAAKLLTTIDTVAASDTMLQTMFHVIRDPRLEVSRAEQIDWAAAYVNQSKNAWDVRVLWEDQAVGPFRNVDWDHVDDTRQAEINAVAGPLLRSFQERLAEVSSHPNDEELQIKAAVKSGALVQIIDQMNLTGETRVKAVALLTQRLEQLIRFRGTHADRPDRNIDVPKNVAAATVLLTGAVPESIKLKRTAEVGYLAERYAATMKLISGRSFPGGGRSTEVTDWYPYEVFEALAESFSNSRNLNEGLVPRQYSLNSKWSREIPARQLDSRLLFDFASASPAAAALANEIVEDKWLQPHMIRHPHFAGAVEALMNSSTNLDALELGYKLWCSDKSQATIDAKLVSWMESDDPMRIRMANNLVAHQNPRSRNVVFDEVWASRVGQAIERIAAQEPLQSQDIAYLDAIDAPQAAAHAIKYLKQRFDRPRSGFGQTTDAGTYSSARILARFPEQATEIKAQLDRFLADPKVRISSNERSVLKHLQVVIAALPQ